MTTVARMLVTALADSGVTTIWGVVGDALNPITDAIRTEERIDWIGVRHEEAGAFAASAQAQLTGTLAVCAGTVGPGSIHLLNGLYDAKKSHVPVLAICGQVPRAEMGSDYFQEVDNDVLFADVAVFCRTVSDPAQAATLLEQAVNAAVQLESVAVLTLPGDLGGLDLPKGDQPPVFVEATPSTMPAAPDIAEVAAVLNAAGKVTLLIGQGARDARDDVLAIADALAAPMVITLKAKEGFDDDNPFEVGQSGLIGNPAAQQAFKECDVLFMIGTDFPYSDWYPEGKTVIQLDKRGEHIGRRTHVLHALIGHCAPTLAALRPLLVPAESREHLESTRKAYESWRERQSHLAEPNYDHERLGAIRKAFDNPEHAIRPEALAAAIDRHAAADAIFTSDTGMSTVWLARYVRMRGRRRLIGSYNLGSMANAMPQALGASSLDRDRQVVGFCGDGGLTMLMGDLITAVTYDLPVKLFVFNNSRLGMVKLEQEQGGLPEFGTVLHNPDLAAVARACGLHGIRVEASDDLDAAVAAALAHPGPVLVDVVTNPDEISIPGRTSLGQAWGFAIAKVKETLESRG